MIRIVHVVCGVIHYNQKMLLGLRPDGGAHGGRWEFPGGKVEQDESSASALRRELLEELGVDVEVPETPFHVWGFAQKTTLLFFEAFKIVGDPFLKSQALEHSALVWVSLNEFLTLDLAEPDLTLRYLILTNPNLVLNSSS